jgi:hypothetical protein
MRRGETVKNSTALSQRPKKILGYIAAFPRDHSFEGPGYFLRLVTASWVSSARYSAKQGPDLLSKTQPQTSRNELPGEKDLH